MLPPRIRRAFRLVAGGRARIDAETDDEIALHIALRVDQLVKLGLSRRDAEAEAERRFGDLRAVRPQLRAAARHREERLTMFERLDNLRDDLRYALRQFRRAPGFTLALTLTFALGIGANATMFGIIDRLLFRPPAFLKDADRVGRVYLRSPRADGSERIDNNITYLRFAELRDSTRTFDAAAAFLETEIVFGAGTDARFIQAGLSSAALWPMFDVRPELGRFFGPDEDRPPNGVPVAVLSHGFWNTQFGADRAVIGKSIRVGRNVYTIIGVAPQGFNGLWTSRIAVFLPITAAARDMVGSDRYYLEHNVSWLEMIARRRAGATVAEANADLTRAYQHSRAAQFAARNVPAPARARQLKLTRGELAPIPYDRGPKMRDEARVAGWLAGVSAIVLLIACVNVANLLLARALRRRREVAVRVALGVSRSRLVAQLLVESVLLALFGGAVGLTLANTAGGVLRGILLPDVDWTLIPPFDGRVLLFTTAAALTTGIITGLAPVAHALGADVSRALKSGEREGGGHRSRLRSGLLVFQAALSVMLLIGAGLFTRSLRNVHTLDLGWDANHLLYVRTDHRGTTIPRDEQRQLLARMVERVRAVSGVTHAATTVDVPFWSTWTESVFVPGMDSASRLAEVVINPVSGDYFQTTGTRILRGRAVTDADRSGMPLVAVVSDSLGRMLWKGRDPIGQCLRFGADTAPCREVVGIAQDIRQGALRHDDGLEFYVPAGQSEVSGGIFVRTAGEARFGAEAVRRELQRLMPGNGYADVRPMAQILDPIVRPWSLGASMFSIFGALALALAAVGLYGVIAYNVAQRTHELGVRVALGAQGPDILRLIVWHALRIAGAGGVAGAVIAIASGQLVAPLLFGISPRDPFVLGGAVMALLFVAAAASLLPARRATRVDPVVALRTE